jgi:hypothetical protein
MITKHSTRGAFRALLIAGLLAAVAACGGINPTAPESDASFSVPCTLYAANGAVIAARCYPNAR